MAREELQRHMQQRQYSMKHSQFVGVLLLVCCLASLITQKINRNHSQMSPQELWGWSCTKHSGTRQQLD